MTINELKQLIKKALDGPNIDQENPPADATQVINNFVAGGIADAVAEYVKNPED